MFRRHSILGSLSSVWAPGSRLRAPGPPETDTEVKATSGKVVVPSGGHEEGGGMIEARGSRIRAEVIVRLLVFIGPRGGSSSPRLDSLRRFFRSVP